MMSDSLGPSIANYIQTTYREGQSHAGFGPKLKTLLTLSVVPLERRKVRRLLSENKRIKLHLGCSDTYLDGWVNVDLARPGRRLDLQWDLRRGIPFPDRSVSLIFSEHLWEHIPLPGGFQLLQECYRALKPGGLIRIGVPNLDRYLKSYFERDDVIDNVRPGRPTRALALSELFYFYDHRAMYDAATLTTMLKEVGFENAVQTEFGGGRMDPSVDSLNRKSETLYVEANR